MDTEMETVVFEGWLNVWEVGKDMMKNMLSDGKMLKPIWEPHLCALTSNSRKLSHFRTEQAAHDALQNMTVTLEHIGGTKEEFDRRYGYKSVDKHDLLLNSPLADLDAAIEKSQTLDSRNSHVSIIGGGTMPASLEKSSSSPEGRRGSTSSLNSQEVVKPATTTSSSQSKLANFFTKKLKRTKSATKLDRKKCGSGSNGDAEKEKIRNQKMAKSYSHESLLTLESSLHCIDLSADGVEVRPVHCSILGLDYCFVVVAGGCGGCKYYGCTSIEERNCWIRHLRHVIQPSLDQSYRKENSLEITIAEAKNLPVKRKYFCEICIDRTVYARTTSKSMLDMLFWGEHFEFINLPSVEMITLNLYRETEKKKKKGTHTLLAYVNIATSEINSRQMCEHWFSASSAVVGKLGKENRTDCASIRLKARYQSVSILPISLYQPLISYLKSEYRLVVDTLEPVVNVKAKEEIAASMVTSFHCLNCITSFICDIVMTEFNRSDNMTLALRGNSIATKAVEAYMRLVGSKYLINTLSELVKMLLDPNLDCEVDPARVSSAAVLKVNQDALIKHCKMFWHRIYSSIPSFPIELRKIFYAIRLESSKGNYGGDICDQLISSCVFLRFFCPAILNPSLFNITQEYPDERGARNLTLVAKTIQGLANLTGFGGKETFMTFMNNFVSNELSQMRRFLNYISDVESDHGLKMQFEGEVDLGKELAVLHRLLIESLKGLNEIAKENLRDLPSVLQDITVAQNHPVIQPPTKRSRLCVNLDNSAPSASEFVVSIITPSSTRRFNPPCTPTTVVSSLTPETITFITPLPSSDTKSPVEMSFTSMTSLSLSPSPNSHKTPVINVSTLPCSSGVNRISGGPRSLYHYQSTDDLVVTHQLDSALPLCDESLSPSVSSLSNKCSDEKQLRKDWEKMKDAAESFSTSKCLKLIPFNDSSRTNPGKGSSSRTNPGKGSFDKKLDFHGISSSHCEGSSALPLSQPFFTSDAQDIQKGLPDLKSLAFSNPVYESIDLNMMSTNGAEEEVFSPHMGSTTSIINDDGVNEKPRQATPPGFKDGSTPLKMTSDVCGTGDCFKSSSSDSLAGRLDIEPCPQHRGKCLQMTIPIAGAGTNNHSSFCSTINIPMSKSLDFPSSVDSPALSIERVGTDSHIVAVSNFENRNLNAGRTCHYNQMTLPSEGSRYKTARTITNMDCNDEDRRPSDELGSSLDSVPLNSFTLPQPSSRRQNCDSGEFSRQMDLVSRTVAETRAMVANAELQLLGKRVASPLSASGPVALVSSSAHVTDQSCLDGGLRQDSGQKSIHGKSSAQMESHLLTGSTPAATVESQDKVTVNDYHIQVPLDSKILPTHVSLHNETVFTLSLNDHSQPFRTTYC